MNETRPLLKRGGFARDARTGQIVRIAEVGGRDWMVRTAYKSDGYWADSSHLVPVQDPHIWTGKDLVLLVVMIMLAGWGAYSTYVDLTGYGVPGANAVTSGSLPVGAVIWFGLGRLFRLVRN